MRKRENWLLGISLITLITTPLMSGLTTLSISTNQQEYQTVVQSKQVLLSSKAGEQTKPESGEGGDTLYISPVLEGTNPNQPDKIPVFNIYRLPNSNLEKKLYSLDVTVTQAKSLILKNIPSFFGQTLSTQGFEENLKANSFTILNRPTNVYVFFTLKNVVTESNNTIHDEKYTLVLDGFIDAKWTELTWLIYMCPVIALVIISVTIYSVITKKHLKKKRTPGIVDGEYIIE